MNGSAGARRCSPSTRWVGRTASTGSKRSSRRGEEVKGRSLFTLGVGLALIAMLTPIARGAQRPVGDIRIFTTLAYPGHPGGLAVDGRTLYIDTATGFDRDFDGSDQVWSYNLDSRKPLATNPNPI